MNRHFHKLALPIVAFFIFPSLGAAEELNAGSQLHRLISLEEMVRTVLQHNPRVQAAALGSEAARATVTSASALQNPRIESTVGRNAARLPSSNSGNLGGWGVSQFIENPAVRRARTEAANFNLAISEQLIASTKSELVAQVRIKAFEHLLRKDEARAATDALQLLEQIRARVKVRVESGEAARYEIIKADAEVINARQKLQTALLQVEQSVLAINRLAAGSLPAHWRLRETLGDMIEPPALEQIQQSAQLNNPELKALQAETARREAKLQETQAGRWPGIELRYGQLKDADISQRSLTASLQIPLLDQRHGAIQESIAELSRARLLLDSRRTELAQQVLQAWKSMEIARVKVNALSTGAVREAEAAVRVAEAAYRFGERGILDVLDAQRVLRQVNADLLDARFQLRTAGVDLEYLAGLYADTDKLNSALSTNPVTVN